MLDERTTTIFGALGRSARDFDSVAKITRRAGRIYFFAALARSSAILFAASARRAAEAFSSASFFARRSSGVSVFSLEPSYAFQLDLPATESLKEPLRAGERDHGSVADLKRASFDA